MKEAKTTTVIIHDTDKKAFCKMKDEFFLRGFYAPFPMNVVAMNNELHYVQLLEKYENIQ